MYRTNAVIILDFFFFYWLCSGFMLGDYISVLALLTLGRTAGGGQY